jgi:hypothetical protein
MKREIIEYAKELKSSNVSYKEMVESILNIPAFDRWFTTKYEGNEYDLRIELEEKLTK